MILDIGCGNRKTPNSIGVDIDPNSQADVIYNLNKFPYPFRDNQADKITCIEVIEHLDTPGLFLDELHRILKPNGILTISTNNRNSLVNRLFKTYNHNGLEPSPGTHKKIFTIEELKFWIKFKGFKIKKLKMLPFPCSYKHKTLRILLNPIRFSINYILPNSLRERMVIRCRNQKRGL